MKFFCTDGIRGRAIDLICSNIVVKLGQILGEKSKKILIGYDTRVSSPQIVNLLVNGIVTKSCNVDIVHVVSTPMISFFLMNYKYDYGIMVTASHNPYFDNGIKIFNSSGEKIDQLEIDDIKEKFNHDIPFSLSDKLGELKYLNKNDEYLAFINSLIDFTNQYKIVIDCANGSFSFISEQLKLNNITYINNQPNGKNINDHVGACYPEMLQNYVKKHNLDYGFAFDGDGDRLIMVDKNKIYQGDDIMVNLIDFFHYNNVVFTKIVNQGLIDYCKKNKIHYQICDVGDSNVLNTMKIENADFGGEPSGHFIYKDHLYSDGLFSLIRVLRIINTGKWINFNHYETISYDLVHSSELYQKKEEIENFIITTLSLDDFYIIRESGTEDKLRINIQSLNKDTINKIRAYFKNMEK